MMPWSVCVFAHNEQSRIAACLESVLAAAGARPVRIYVMANGCTDRTVEVAGRFAAAGRPVAVVESAIGDKAGAWNQFVHDVMPPTGVAFFVDGDVRVTPGSLGELAQTLDDHPEANAAAAVPMSGRDRLEQTRLVTENHLVLGCFYALRGSFLQKIKARGVRLPAGYIGEDGLVTSLVKADLGIRGQWVKARVAPCPRAGFVFRSLSLARPADWRLYWRRRIRYSLRHIQHELLKPQLMSAGAAALPADVAALYRTGDPARHVRARGVDALFDRIALRRIARARRAD